MIELFMERPLLYRLNSGCGVGLSPPHAQVVTSTHSNVAARKQNLFFVINDHFLYVNHVIAVGILEDQPERVVSAFQAVG